MGVVGVIDEVFVGGMCGLGIAIGDGGDAFELVEIAPAGVAGGLAVLGSGGGGDEGVLAGDVAGGLDCSG